MKFVLKIAIPLLVIIGVIAFFWEDYQEWNYLRAFQKDPIEFGKHAAYEMAENQPEKNRKILIDAFLHGDYDAKLSGDATEEELEAIFEIFEVFRLYIDHERGENATLAPEAFTAYMEIYKASEEDDLHRNIASVMKNAKPQIFYDYFLFTRKHQLPFHDGMTSRKSTYPEVKRHGEQFTEEEKELWCKHAFPIVKAERQALLEEDSVSKTFQLLNYTDMEILISCEGDINAFRKALFDKWSDHVGTWEEQYPDDFEQKYLAYQRKKVQPQTMIDAISLTYLIPSEITDPTGQSKKEFLDYVLRMPPDSKLLCIDLMTTLAFQYRHQEVDIDVFMKLKEWVKLADIKHPDLGLEARMNQMFAF